MLLLAADGVANTVIAEHVGVTPVTVRAWRQRFGDDGLAELGKSVKVVAASRRSRRRRSQGSCG